MIVIRREKGERREAPKPKAEPQKAVEKGEQTAKRFDPRKLRNEVMGMFRQLGEV